MRQSKIKTDLIGGLNWDKDGFIGALNSNLGLSVGYVTVIVFLHNLIVILFSSILIRAISSRPPVELETRHCLVNLTDIG